MNSGPLSMAIRCGTPTVDRNRVQERHDPLPGQGGADRDRRAHPAHGIDYRQHPEAPTVGQAVGEEIEAPALLRPRGGGGRTRGALASFFRRFTRIPSPSSRYSR